MFENLVVQPLFNLLVLIYALIPGHNFGIALIVFTVLIRLMMWPLLKKQLHHTREIRKLQPELKKIKKATKGDKQKESMLVMELYKERQISPFGSLGIIIVQFIIMIGLYSGVSKVVKDTEAIKTLTYGWIANLSWMKELFSDLSKFDETVVHVIDLSRPAIGPEGLYFWGLLLVIGSAAVQFFQSSQLLPKDKDAKKLRTILKEAGTGRQAEQADINAAIGQNTRYIIPVMILFFTVTLPSALSLYWLTGGLVALWQQSKILGQDEDELEETADKTEEKDIIEGEIIEKPKAKKVNKTKQANKKSSTKSKKRRKK